MIHFGKVVLTRTAIATLDQLWGQA
jgi:hypothetical protein